MADGGAEIRSLFISGVTPWPEQSGNRRRMSSVLRALSTLGPVDAFLMVGRQGATPDRVPIRDVEWGPTSTTSRRRMDELRWLLDRRPLPSDLIGLDIRSTSNALRRWVTRTGHEYDFVWCSRPQAYLATRGVVSATTVIDVDDLEDRKLAARLEAGVSEEGTWSGPHLPGWQRLARRKMRRNVSAWRNLYDELAREVDGLALCSDEDRRQSRLHRSLVVPNCYPAPTPVADPGPVAGGIAPVFLLVGLMTYRPNADGAAWFVREVLPIIRSVVPDAQARIVGEAGDRVRALADDPGVTVTGRVTDVGDELRRASVSVAPVRFAGGTRLKILEAWAYGLPVVSTPQGAAGLAAVDGEHLLLADGPAAFAEACTRALADVDLRGRLTVAGAALYRERFTCERIERALGEDVKRLVASSRG